MAIYETTEKDDDELSTARPLTGTIQDNETVYSPIIDNPLLDSNRMMYSALDKERKRLATEKNNFEE